MLKEDGIRAWAHDELIRLAIGQGYVPTKCTLPGVLVMALVMEGKDPCDGCEEDREECGGRQRI